MDRRALSIQMRVVKQSHITEIKLSIHGIRSNLNRDNRGSQLLRSIRRLRRATNSTKTRTRVIMAPILGRFPRNGTPVPWNRAICGSPPEEQVRHRRNNRRLLRTIPPVNYQLDFHHGTLITLVNTLKLLIWLSSPFQQSSILACPQFFPSPFFCENKKFNCTPLDYIGRQKWCDRI